MNKALILVDVQNDFLPNGALGVPNGHKATILMERLMHDVDVIVFTRDWHPADHSSFAEGTPEYKDGSWPPHCVAGTEGAEIDTWLWEQALDTGKPILLVHKGADKDKEAYSGFEGVVADTFNRDAFPRLAEDLLWNHARDRGVTLQEALVALSVYEVKVGGLALDYCVKATALDATALDYRTTVYLNATRPVAYLSGVNAVATMAYSGVILSGREL